jgi:hypothetical protein
MVVTYVGSFPPDPKADAENFQRKQAEYEAAYRRTEEPFVLVEALWHAQAAQQLTPDWLVTAAGNAIMGNRAKDTAERFKERMRHVRRYRCIRDLRQKRPNKDGVLECLTKDQALKLATAKLEAAGDTATQRTIEDSYDRVNRDLKRAGQKSEFFWLVARSDPTMVPVRVSRTKSGEVIVNGVVQPKRSEGATGSVTASPTVWGRDRWPNDHGGRDR